MVGAKTTNPLPPHFSTCRHATEIWGWNNREYACDCYNREYYSIRLEVQWSVTLSTRQTFPLAVCSSICPSLFVCMPQYVRLYVPLCSSVCPSLVVYTSHSFRLYARLFVCMPQSVRLYVPVCSFVCPSMFVYMSQPVCLYVPVCSSICPSMFLCMSQSVRLCIHQLVSGNVDIV